MLKGTVISPFSIVRKTASRKLAHVQVITDAIAANPLAGTGFIGAITVLQIPILLTFHTQLLNQDNFIWNFTS